MKKFITPKQFELYRGLLYSAPDIVKKDPGRAKQKSLATAVTNFTKPGAQNKGDLCTACLQTWGTLHAECDGYVIKKGVKLSS